ncbi:hypothetical protein FH972_021349 [Carpinus fangiana]|uniref:Uncharacterized protein n=1 Tax=Carpinus fangiana TaxID=176857 RepID=A0A5N6KPP8_9ROSI|nr:hypothetical protein FH972_021349 [Carpinus fangiana]
MVVSPHRRCGAHWIGQARQMTLRSATADDTALAGVVHAPSPTAGQTSPPQKED